MVRIRRRRERNVLLTGEEELDSRKLVFGTGNGPACLVPRE